MKSFCDLLEMYLQDGYAPDLAYRLALRAYREQKRDNADFYYDHPEGVRL